jgi:maleylpyruvate isomerase
MAVPSTSISGCRRAQAALLVTIGDLSEAQCRAPSLLPGWSVGHVLTHIARNADSVVRRLDGAARDEVVDQYPGGYESRAADIKEGAHRPSAELVADVQSTAAAVDWAITHHPADAWERVTRDVGGRERPASSVIFSRWREVEVHHADLGLGFTPDMWSANLVNLWLPEELVRLPERGRPADLLAWLLGRGPAPPISPW